VKYLIFNINKKLSVFTLCFLPLLVYLGFWQLQRADQKATLLEKWAVQQQSLRIPINEVSSSSPEYAPVVFEARFDQDRYWLQEGKTYQGRSGYMILMLAHTKTQRYLVNRGWVPADPNREILPSIATPSSTVRLTGSLKRPSLNPLTDEKNNPVRGWPHRILEIDLSNMQQQYGEPIEGWVIELDQADPSAFAVPTRQVPVTPEKHRAYAIQWFSMAVTLLVLWFIASTNIIPLLKQKRRHNG
jgi:surfeit locus 1 family protein